MSTVAVKPASRPRRVNRPADRPVEASRWRTSAGRLSRSATLALGAALVLLAMVWGAASGAYAIAPNQLPGIAWDGIRSLFGGEVHSGPEHLVFLNIRLPRLLMGVAAGAGLGLAGALMQGLFRNPLADPGLIGVSSGAALAAGVTIVLGGMYLPWLPRHLGSWALVAMAFGGGLAVTAVVYVLGQVQGATRIGLMLLAGIAINALAGAGLGFLSFVSTDEQLRNLQMWLLGSLGASRWSAVGLVSAGVAVSIMAALALARPLNAIALGEAQANLLGVAVEKTKRRAVMVAALAVGAVTATTGIIGFIGLVAPHWVRLMAGPDHRVVLPGSALLGAALVVSADAVARTIAKPAELPLGVLTAFIGVPLFLAMLRQFRSKV
ncbi:FecCD family ABC transporter permease [Comamonas resistens]|uniref:Iron ABC transporter permease n=1 Tax=Comamonas resistens TaxID=3046670 RepID=A0ABY8SVI1_9BURK|nr:iron ABC transporter permease [Comamonas resistens]MDL5035166.1 iron ABC transporter permease [Comamonas resistens]WHS66765.1 iron ABC transporter permease [Comamonas resistens]